jgi:hypothetical protein
MHERLKVTIGTMAAAGSTQAKKMCTATGTRSSNGDVDRYVINRYVLHCTVGA